MKHPAFGAAPAAREICGGRGLPMTPAENDRLYGESKPYDDSHHEACNAIRKIPQALFSPECAKAILEAVGSKLATSNFTHIKPFDAIAEHVDEAAIGLESMS